LGLLELGSLSPGIEVERLASKTPGRIVCRSAQANALRATRSTVPPCRGPVRVRDSGFAKS